MAVLNSEVEQKALTAVRTLARLGAVRAAYVFGSHVEGGADRWSDIDLAVFMEGIENWDIQKRARAMALVMVEVGSDVESHLFPCSALDDPAPGGFVEYVVHHGVRISG